MFSLIVWGIENPTSARDGKFLLAGSVTAEAKQGKEDKQ